MKIVSRVRLTFNDDCNFKKASILSLFERKNKDASLYVCSVVIYVAAFDFQGNFKCSIRVGRRVS